MSLKKKERKEVGKEKPPTRKHLRVPWEAGEKVQAWGGGEAPGDWLVVPAGERAGREQHFHLTAAISLKHLTSHQISENAT